MRYRNRINELRQTINAASATWTPERSEVVSQTPPQSRMLPGCCTRCGGQQSANAGPSCYGVRAYCARCFPMLGQLADELTRLTDAQSKRDGLARKLKDYRHDAAALTAKIGPRFQHCWFRTYRPQNATQSEAAQQLFRWAGDEAAQAKFPFFVLRGAPGLGKTHLAVAAARRSMRKVGLTYVVNEGKFMADWHRAYDRGSGYGGLSPTQLVDEACTATVLVWDDLGKAKLSDAWARVIYQIVDHRYEQNLPTLVTTNYGPAELAARVQLWTADRVLSGLSFALEGSSMRGAA